MPNNRNQSKIREVLSLLDFKLPKYRRGDDRLAKALTIWDLREIAMRRTPRAGIEGIGTLHNKCVSFRG